MRTVMLKWLVSIFFGTKSIVMLSFRWIEWALFDPKNIKRWCHVWSLKKPCKFNALWTLPLLYWKKSRVHSRLCKELVPMKTFNHHKARIALDCRQESGEFSSWIKDCRQLRIVLTFHHQETENLIWAAHDFSKWEMPCLAWLSCR